MAWALALARGIHLQNLPLCSCHQTDTREAAAVGLEKLGWHLALEHLL